MTIDTATLFASVVLNLVPAGFLGHYLLEKLRRQHEAEVAQLRSDLEGSNRQLQTFLDRTSFVHRLQFETELKAVQHIWTKVVTLRGYMAALRPTFSRVPEGQTEEQALDALGIRFRAFKNALEDLKDALFENELFIPEAIYRELSNNLLGAAVAEDINVSLHAKKQPVDWYDKGEANLGKYLDSANKAGTLIRHRFAMLSQIPSSGPAA